MTEHMKQTIAVFEAKLKTSEEDVRALKRLLNTLYREAGMPAQYDEGPAETNKGLAGIRGDQFYGRPLSTVVKEYLEMRRSSDKGPATVNEIFDAMKDGGYKFEAKDDENAKRGLRISLTKNSSIFHRLPTGAYGLLAWYPDAKAPKASDEDSEEEAEPPAKARIERKRLNDMKEGQE